MMCLKSDPDSARRSAALLRAGEVVILPTDTVYGFSGVVGKTDGRIRQIKGRGEDKPFVRLIAEPRDIRAFTDDAVPESLTARWPGALSVIVRDRRDRTKTFAYRCPGDPWLRDVIRMTGVPLYSTSVNRSGRPVLDTVEEIRAEFETEVALVVSDGDRKDALPSTIVRIEAGAVVVVRQGGVRL